MYQKAAKMARKNNNDDKQDPASDGQNGGTGNTDRVGAGAGGQKQFLDRSKM
jgi:hypothetical protein